MESKGLSLEPANLSKGQDASWKISDEGRRNRQCRTQCCSGSTQGILLEPIYLYLGWLILLCQSLKENS